MSFKFDSQSLLVLKKMQKIGEISKNESFVVCDKEHFIASHAGGGIHCLYEHKLQNMPEPFALYDINKLLRVLEDAKKVEDSSMKIEKKTILFKYNKTKHKFSLIDFKFTYGKNDIRKTEKGTLAHKTTMSPSRFNEVKDKISDSRNHISEFVLTKEDIKTISNFQRCMNTNKFRIYSNNDNDIVVECIAQPETKDCDTSDFIIENISKNEMIKNNVIWFGNDNINPISYLFEDDYKIVLADLGMVMTGTESGIVYLIAATQTKPRVKEYIQSDNTNIDENETEIDREIKEEFEDID